MTARRRLIASGAAALALGPALAQAPSRLPRIGVLFNNPPLAEMTGPDPKDPNLRALIHALRDLDLVDGRTVHIECASAEGDPKRLPALLRGLVGGGADVLVINGSPAVAAALEVTRTVPVVCVTGVESHVASLARPGGNLTGLSNQAGPSLFLKRLELLKDAVPAATQVIVLRPPPPPGHRAFLATTEAAARRIGVTLSTAYAALARDLDAAFAAVAAARPHAMVCADYATYYGRRRRIAAFARSERLPAIFSERQYAHAGGLLAYGASFAELFARAAGYVHRILKGARPAELPVEQPNRFELVINVTTAQAIGLAIDPRLRLRADLLIE